MLRNSVYRGMAMFGRTRSMPAKPRLRPIGRRTQAPKRASGSRSSTPREEWIAISVPALVDEAQFEAAQLQLDENRKRKREGRRQFTSPRFTAVLTAAGVRISMDGRGRWMDNVFIERLWRSLKYECVYLHAFETGSELRTSLACWIGYYNGVRPHSSLGGMTPDEAYAATGTERTDTERLAA